MATATETRLPAYGNGPDARSFDMDPDLRRLSACQRSSCVSDGDRVRAMQAAMATAQNTNGRHGYFWRHADFLCGLLAAAGYCLRKGESDTAPKAFKRIGVPDDKARLWEEYLAAQGYCIVRTSDPEPIQITSGDYRKAYNKLRRRFGQAPARDLSRVARASMKGVA